MDAREHARFESVVLPHLDAAYTLARYLTRSEADAEDAVQDACLRALRHFPTYRGDEGPSARAWLLTIVRNVVFTRHRYGRAESEAVEFDEEMHSEVAAETTPEEQLMRGEMRSSIQRALGQLSVEFREVIVLREIEGLSYKEIGAVTGVPVGTVMSRLSRARKHLHSALAREGAEG